VPEVALNEIERRVLGVLIEKSLAQPTYYPMTLNAIIAGCNQKSNRDPVVELDEDTVWNALDALRERGFVSRILAGMGGRVDRFRHEVKTAFNWEKPQRAVMAELMLRGPQTLGELRTRCTRLYPFENADAVAAVVQMLCECDPPLVAASPRAPGQSAVRYAHRLYPAGEQPVVAEPQPAAATSLGVTADSRRAPGPADSRLEAVEEQIAGLRETIAELGRRLAALEQQLL
jgi:uncharacterized protein YceH (UPF0502 family)